MKIIFFLFFFLFISKSFAGEKSAIVLMYHRFEDQRFPSTSISSKNFQDQIRYLKENNFNILPISDLVLFFNENHDIPDKSVFITIDDGYKSFYEHAFPILKKYKVPFALFLSTKFVSNEKKSDFMSWKMIEELSKNKGQILNHTDSHPKLLELQINEVKKEFSLAEKKIISKIGRLQKVVSYPYGESNHQIQKLVKEMGYDIGFAQHSSPIHISENKLALPRFAINDEFGKINRFIEIVNSKALVVSDVKVLKNDINLEELEISFSTNKIESAINCYINNDATLKKKIIDNEIINLEIANLKKKKRYRLNCTYFDEKRNLFWYGKMIKITEESIIF
ncbi:MAG: hypothetical protein CMM98_00750 [Rickettsiales bacterium]|nr:hypothetical protein [Rickettsiales bacterium]